MKMVESAAIEDEVETIERNNFVSFAESFVPKKQISSFYKSLVFSPKRQIRRPWEGSSNFSPTPI